MKIAIQIPTQWVSIRVVRNTIYICIVYLQDFNMVKIESRLQTISIRQAFLIGNESYSGKKI